MIKLFHGSNIDINKVDLSICKPGKDFGRGFYLNPDFDQANMMAQKTARIIDKGSAVVNAFEFDDVAAQKSGLNIKCFDGYCEEWAEFIVANRKNNSQFQIHDYDIVIGPIADDSVGVQIRRYILGYLPIVKLVEELKFNGSNAVQYFFATEKALCFLRKI